ncbi:MAG: hypothetical protein WBD40_06920 [Tepidisphaeraceae bacterium]
MAESIRKLSCATLFGISMLVGMSGCGATRCGREITRKTLHGTMEMEFYKDYALYVKRALAADSAESQRIRQIVAAKEAKWRFGFSPHAPGVIVRANGVTLNFGPRLLIAEFRNEAGNPVQLVAPATAEEFDQVAAMRPRHAAEN